MRKAIITGAGGFIGGALTQRLLSENVIVYGVDVSNKMLDRFTHFNNFVPIIADFSHYNELYKSINASDIDVMYHFAWRGVYGKAFSDYEMQLNNSISSCEALMQAAKIGCRRFVFAGTVNQYETNTFINLDYFEPRNTYVYSTAKHAAESIGKTLAFNNAIDFCAGRVAMAYGEHNKSMMITNVVIKNLLENKPSSLVAGNNLYDVIYIDDIVEGFIAIGELGKNMKSYYIGHRQVKTFKEIIQDIAEVLNPTCELNFGSYPDAPTGVDYAYIDTEALYKDTGFECRSDFKESIIKTANWIKKEYLEE